MFLVSVTTRLSCSGTGYVSIWHKKEETSSYRFPSLLAEILVLLRLPGFFSVKLQSLHDSLRLQANGPRLLSPFSFRDANGAEGDLQLSPSRCSSSQLVLPRPPSLLVPADGAALIHGSLPSDSNKRPFFMKRPFEKADLRGNRYYSPD